MALDRRAGDTRVAALEELRARFARAGIPERDAAVEAELLLCHALGIGRAECWVDPGAPVTPEHWRALESLAVRRERRVPVQLLIGSVGFHEVTLAVEPGVFLPRPETETLVETVLEALGSRASEGRLLDLGTGTGAAAIALLAALPGWTAVALDRSPAAVALSRRNAALNGVAPRFTAVEGDFRTVAAPWLDRAPYDVVVSNPPYIPSATIPGLEPEVRDHDPREALDGGPDGLDAYRAIARVLPRILRSDGFLAVEMGDDQADRIRGILAPGGSRGVVPCDLSGTGEMAGTPDALRGISIKRDLAGRPRVLLTTWRGGVA
jgi:release factor glutamine methyltransferase